MWKEKHDTLYDHSSDFHCDTLYLWKYHFPVWHGVSSENLGTKNRSCRRCSKIWKSNLCVSSDSLPPTWTLFLSHTLWHLDTHTQTGHTQMSWHPTVLVKDCVFIWNFVDWWTCVSKFFFFNFKNLNLRGERWTGRQGWDSTLRNANPIVSIFCDF